MNIENELKRIEIYNVSSQGSEDLLYLDGKPLDSKEVLVEFIKNIIDSVRKEWEEEITEKNVNTMIGILLLKLGNIISVSKQEEIFNEIRKVLKPSND